MTKTIASTTAGRFYPSDPRRLREDISAYLAAAPADCRPKAIIAPHAAYDYCGPVAGYAYGQVRSLSGSVSRVLLLGRCHVRPELGLIATSADALATPLGDVRVDRDALELAHSSLKGRIVVDDDAHTRDHSVQVQLPFLQLTLDRFAVAPFLVGSLDKARVADLIGELGGADDTLVVVSSDLSHFHEYGECNRVDRRTAELIGALDSGAIGPQQACGSDAIGGLLITAARRRWTARLLALRNSGDAGGGRTRVVGYGAFAFVASQDLAGD